MCEDAPCCGCCGQNESAEGYEEMEMDGAGWPGDGSGEDDLADYNANEGGEDSWMDGANDE